MSDTITILGTRGSLPMCGGRFIEYGGLTTCVLVHMGGQYLVLDAGTGIMDLPEEAMRQTELPLVLTHTHVDHLMGMPMCPYVMRKGSRLDIYGRTRAGLTVRQQVDRLLSPPLWPVTADDFLTELRFHELPETLTFGSLRVDTMEGVHSGGVSLVRLEAEGKRVVFATDCTLNDEMWKKLGEFARDCDLLLLDGQYTDEEWPSRSTFGHSTWRMAAEFARSCGAKRLRVTHHDPQHTDTMLKPYDAELQASNPAYRFAREGERIEL